MFQRFAFIFALLILLCASTATQIADARQTSTDAPQTQPSHRIRLKGLDGKLYDIAGMRGDVLVVSFGATWCTPCNWELVALEELKEEYQGQPVRFFWVSIDDPKRASKYLLRDFVKERGVTFPVLRDPTMETFLQFADTTRIPVVAFFDRDGQFSAPTHRGMSSEISEFKALIRRRVNLLLPKLADKKNGRGSDRLTCALKIE